MRDYGKKDKPNEKVEHKKHSMMERVFTRGGNYERGPQKSYMKHFAGGGRAGGNDGSAGIGKGNEVTDLGPDYTTGGGFGSGPNGEYVSWGKNQERVPETPIGTPGYPGGPVFVAKPMENTTVSTFTRPGQPTGIPYPNAKPENVANRPGPPKAKPGIGGPLGPPVRNRPEVPKQNVSGPRGPMLSEKAGSVSPVNNPNMGEFGEYGTDPFGYGSGSSEPGVVGGSFAGGGYGTPSYGVNPAQAGHEFNAANREGFSYGGYGTNYNPGTGSSNPSSNKIVCTEMNRQYGFGAFRNAIWLEYARKHLTKEHEVGYHAIFGPLLAYARGGKSWPRRAVWASLQHIARERTADLRAEMAGGKRRPLGRAYRAVLEPLCCAVGAYLKR